MDGVGGKEGKGCIFKGSTTLTKVRLNECTHQLLSSFLDKRVRGGANSSLLDARVALGLIQLWRVCSWGRKSRIRFLNDQLH